jgi:uncharacterized tellurite resistance protein B-like protein
LPWASASSADHSEGGTALVALCDDPLVRPRPNAINTWIAVLSGGGVLHGEREAEGVVLASRIVGEERLSQLRAWLEVQTEEDVEDIRSAELCMWMAVADRVIDPRERELLADIVRSSGLSSPEEARLLALLPAALSDVRRLPHVETLAERMDHPVLRELMLALVWHVARADGFVDALEGTSYERLAAIFGVEHDVAAAISDVLEAP